MNDERTRRIEREAKAASESIDPLLDVTPATPRQTSSHSAARTPLTTVEPAIWLLPTGGPDPWVVCDPEAIERSIAAKSKLPPLHVASGLSAADLERVLEGGRSTLDSAFNTRMKSALQNLVRTAAVAAIIVAGGIAALWYWPLVGGIAIGAGILLGIFGLQRHGGKALRTHHARVDARISKNNADIQRSKLLERIHHALAYRRATPDDQHGAAPDKELLDVAAYRKLIRDGETTADELAAVAAAVQHTLRLDIDNPSGSSSQLAAAAGIDPLTAAFYRDLAIAAAEIKLDANLALPE